MPRVGLPSSVSVFEQILSEKLTTQESLVGPMLSQDGQIYRRSLVQMNLDTDIWH